MKKYIVVGLLVLSFIITPVFVSAQTPQQDQTAILISLLQSLIQLLQQQLSTLRGVQPLSPQQQTDILQNLNNSTTKHISSLSPKSGPVGTSLNISGNGFAGYDTLWMENKDGLRGVLIYHELTSTDNATVEKRITVPIPPRLCQQDEGGRGMPCSSWMEVIPSTYKIFFTGPNNLGQYSKTNAVDFTVPTVVENSKCGLTVNSPTPNSSVSFPLIVTGVVDNRNASQLGCSWQTFEGIAGTAQFYIFLNEINHKGWTPIGDIVHMQLESSATGKSSFSLVFNYPEGGFQINAPIKIVFVEENVASIRPALIFELPLVLK